MKILFAEDDRDLCRAMEALLKHAGYTVDVVNNGRDALDYAGEGDYDGLILDWMMPGMDGIRVLEALRGRGVATPCLMLTARDAVEDRVTGLDAGADDYIVKPFGIMELLARVRAVMRRSERVSSGRDYRIGDLYISADRHEVKKAGEPISLTFKEFALLELLAANEGKALTRGYLMDKIWDLGSEPENRTLDVHIRSLRSKLGDAGDCIETVRGVGYRLKDRII